MNGRDLIFQLLFGLERFLMALVETLNNMDEQTWSEIGKTSANFKPFKGEACCGADGKIILDILDNHGFYSELHKNFSKVNLAELNESFTKKIKNRRITGKGEFKECDKIKRFPYVCNGCELKI